MNEYEVALTVRPALFEEIHRDIARVNEAERGPAESGFVYVVQVSGLKQMYLVLRGIPDGERGVIRLDEASRIALAVDQEKSYTFTFRKAGWWGQLVWAWRASDPAYAIAARLGVLSLVLAILSVIPMAISIVRWLISLVSRTLTF